jgi:hypothetical protein
MRDVRRALRQNGQELVQDCSGHTAPYFSYDFKLI